MFSEACYSISAKFYMNVLWENFYQILSKKFDTWTVDWLIDWLYGV